MRTIAILFFFFIVLGCNNDPDPKPVAVGVDYTFKKDKKPAIKAEDTVRFKKLERQSDSVIYARLMDFKTKVKESKIQNLKISKKKVKFKLEDVSENYQNFINRIDLPKQSTESTKNQNEESIKLKNTRQYNQNFEDSKRHQVPIKGNKQILDKPKLNSEEVNEMAANFDEALLTVARAQKNNFISIIGAKLKKASNLTTKYSSKVKFPVAQSTYVLKGLSDKNEVVVRYLETRNKEEAREMYEALVQLYEQTSIDENQLISEEIVTDLHESTIMMPMVLSSSRYFGFMITINFKTNHNLDQKLEFYKEYYVSVRFEAD
jgi:hypothetical protein